MGNQKQTTMTKSGLYICFILLLGTSLAITSNNTEPSSEHVMKVMAKNDKVTVDTPTELAKADLVAPWHRIKKTHIHKIIGHVRKLHKHKLRVHKHKLIRHVTIHRTGGRHPRRHSGWGKRSLSHRVKFRLMVTNRRRRAIKMTWLNYHGKPVSYGLIQPGHTKHMNTYDSHPWVFTEDRVVRRYTGRGHRAGQRVHITIHGRRWGLHHRRHHRVVVHHRHHHRVAHLHKRVKLWGALHHLRHKAWLNRHKNWVKRHRNMLRKNRGWFKKHTKKNWFRRHRGWFGRWKRHAKRHHKRHAKRHARRHHRRHHRRSHVALGRRTMVRILNGG